MKTKIFIVIFLLTAFTRISYGNLPDRYHTYEEMEQEIHELAANYPDITRLDTLCYLPNLYPDQYPNWEEMAIYAMKISDNVDSDEDEPVIVYTGVHHAEEVIGLEIVLYIMNDLLSNYGTDPVKTAWIDDNEIWLIPLLNPRGHKVVVEGIDVAYRKNTRDNNENGVFDYDPGIDPTGYPPYDDIDGVDLNRNYDFNWEYGDTTWASETYRGPAPFSEPETQTVRDFFMEVRPTFCINYHSSRSGNYSELVIYPWRKDSYISPDFNHMSAVARNVAQRIIKDTGTGHYASTYGTYFGGFARNWMYGAMGTFAMVVEAGAVVLPGGSFVDSICQRNLVGAYWLFDRLQYGMITGNITDSQGNPLEANIRILEAHDETIEERTSDPIYGRYRRILEPNYGPYTLKVFKEGYETVTIPNIETYPDSITLVDVALTTTKVEDKTYIDVIPTKFELSQNYPNPFNPSTNITYSLPKFSEVSLKIYNTLGQEVETLIDKRQQQGTYSIQWNAEDLSSGVYFYALEADGKKLIKNLVLLK